LPNCASAGQPENERFAGVFGEPQTTFSNPHSERAGMEGASLRSNSFVWNAIKDPSRSGRHPRQWPRPRQRTPWQAENRRSFVAKQPSRSVCGPSRVEPPKSGPLPTPARVADRLSARDERVLRAAVEGLACCSQLQAWQQSITLTRRVDGRCLENLVDRAPQRLVELGAGHLVGQIINQAQRSYSITGANANGSS
jgi:hypothetical protein